MNIHFETESLSHRYSEKVTFENISFALEKGEILSLLGESGAGQIYAVAVFGGPCTPFRRTHQDGGAGIVFGKRLIVRRNTEEWGLFFRNILCFLISTFGTT